MKSMSSRLWYVPWPKVLHQSVGSDHLAGADEQASEEGPLARRPEIHSYPITGNLELPKDLEIHTQFPDTKGTQDNRRAEQCCGRGLSPPNPSARLEGRMRVGGENP